MSPTRQLTELLRWYILMGADEAIADRPLDRFAASAAPSGAASGEKSTFFSSSLLPAQPRIAAPPAILVAPAKAATSARESAERATSLAELEAAVRGFEGCALRRTATNTVFADGNPAAPLMVIGEAPGADEDRIGRPFVGRAGQLLDRMLAAIGLDRSRAYITNTLYWRPPGNRKPTPDEVMACLPFVWRHIALARPQVVLLAGGTSAATLLGRGEGITKLRGRWFGLEVPGLDQPVATLATFHPAFLLRAPARKSDAWNDLLSVRAKLEEPR